MIGNTNNNSYCTSLKFCNINGTKQANTVLGSNSFANNPFYSLKISSLNTPFFLSVNPFTQCTYINFSPLNTLCELIN